MTYTAAVPAEDGGISDSSTLSLLSVLNHDSYVSQPETTTPSTNQTSARSSASKKSSTEGAAKPFTPRHSTLYEAGDSNPRYHHQGEVPDGLTYPIPTDTDTDDDGLLSRGLDLLDISDVHDLLGAGGGEYRSRLLTMMVSTSYTGGGAPRWGVSDVGIEYIERY